MSHICMRNTGYMVYDTVFREVHIPPMTIQGIGDMDLKAVPIVLLCIFSKRIPDIRTGSCDKHLSGF